MAENNTHIIYTAEHIEQYFSGKLTPPEMHAMEKAALDDPFLADAMEGYEEMRGKPWQAQLTAARTQITRKENEQKATPVVVSFQWWKAVAAVLIVGGGVGLAYFFERSSSVNKENTTIAALTKDSATQADTSNMAVMPPAIKADSATRVVVIKDDHAPLIAQVKPHLQPAGKAATETEQLAVEKEPLNALADDKKQDEAKELIAPAPVATAPANNSVSQGRTEGFNNTSVGTAKGINTYKAPTLNNRFSATVTGPDNTPLAYANVLVLDENVGTYADAKGKFKLAAADSILNVRVRAAGYMPQVYPIKSGLSDNRIVLAEQQVAANEVVQLKNKKAPGVMPKIKVHLDSVMNVEPEDGWYNYDTYLSNNLSPAIDKNIHGEVEVIFDVQKDGTVSNVSIAKSLCAACDQEALRVIKEGPQWKVKKGKTDKGKVKVKF